MTTWRWLELVVLATAVAACGPATPEPAPAAAEGKVSGKAPKLAMITPSRLIPELAASTVDPRFEEEGRAMYLLGGLRLLRYDNGHVERADERFPTGKVKVQTLPQRLGGGYVFYQADSQGTRLWRANDWVGKLVPMTHIGPMANELIAGFDRLYLRTKQNKLLALDAKDGKILPLGQLPHASSYGAMAFADGWRGVVDTDLLGAMASFDAGATWRPLALAQRVTSAGILDGDPVLYVDKGFYRVDVRGHLQLVRARDEVELDDESDSGEQAAEHESHPLGERPLRVAIEHGWPDSPSTAVVAYDGALVRVTLPEGTVRGMNPQAMAREDAQCSGARVGKGFGFICGVPHGPTTIYSYRAPLSLVELARFDRPRFVSASGNGSLVIRGGCAADHRESATSDGKSMRRYCILGADGARREVAVRGQLGAERVVALSDGRVVVLVPPRLAKPGSITVIKGASTTRKVLSYPDSPRRFVKVARRGLWLEGFEERGPGKIGGWVEAGGPAIGVTVKLDGTVELGKLYDDGGHLLVAGRFAVATSDAETAIESIDGGMTWRDFEMPQLPESPADAKTRGCSPVGCVFRGWLRVGWGKPAVKNDLESVDAPESASVSKKARPPLKLSCELVARPTEAATVGNTGKRTPYSAWSPFQSKAPPPLGRDQIGVDKASQTHTQTSSHVYVWGPKGADWTRVGWWTVRFHDRFAAFGGVRESARTRPPWGDETSAADAIGARRRSGFWRWTASLDPSGKAALVNVCAGSRCKPYAVSDGQPILPLRGPAGRGLLTRNPVAHGVARVGGSWYFLTELSGAGLTLWRADMGVMQEVASFRRFDKRRYQHIAAPKLVRRALGGELGLLLTVPPDPSSGLHVGKWLALPIDVSRGTLGEPVALGYADLDGKVPRRCQQHDDGWQVDTALAVKPAIDLRGAKGYLDEIELRLRLGPGSVCAEGVAARAGGGFHALGEPKEQTPSAESLPLAARERNGARRWALQCVSR